MFNYSTTADVVQVLAQWIYTWKTMKGAFVSHSGLVCLGIDRERVRIGRNM